MADEELKDLGEEGTGVSNSITGYVRPFLVSFLVVFLLVAGGMAVLHKYAGIRVTPFGDPALNIAESDSLGAAGESDSLGAVAGSDSLGAVAGSDTLGAKEEELAEWERQLARREKEIASREQVAENLMARLTAEKDSMASKRVSQLAKVYEAMRPEEVAPILEALDEATAIRILMKIKQRQAGKILGALTLERAATFSRKITRLD